MYRNGADLQKAETCHMVMWFGGVGAGGGGFGGGGLVKKRTKITKSFTEKMSKSTQIKK